MVKEISKYRFDVYTCMHPTLPPFLDISWMATEDEKIIAVLVFDSIDEDFGYSIFGRDQAKCFRCIDLPFESGFFSKEEQAREELLQKLEEYEKSERDLFPQGDEKSKPLEIFDFQVEQEKAHPFFIYVRENENHEATRAVLKELAYQFKSPDKQYVKEFQLQFNSRLWELFLYLIFRRSGFEIFHQKSFPDFMLKKGQKEFCVEAVTINPSQVQGRDIDLKQEGDGNLREAYFPIKFGSALTSKLKKKYWEKEHIKDSPLLIACHDYHQPLSMVFSEGALQDYLYGIRLTFDAKGQIAVSKIKEHVWQGKKIPSGFFNLPDAENISAVLFANSATVSKFNRMGKLGGFGGSDVKMARIGWLRNPDPFATEPIPFNIDVDSPEYFEYWRESITMFHNPRAKFPIDWSYFPGITHVTWSDEDKTYQGQYEDHHVFGSITHIAKMSKED